jgi:hypothetical protein
MFAGEPGKPFKGGASTLDAIGGMPFVVGKGLHHFPPASNEAHETCGLAKQPSVSPVLLLRLGLLLRIHGRLVLSVPRAAHLEKEKEKKWRNKKRKKEKKKKEKRFYFLFFLQWKTTKHL